MAAASSACQYESEQWQVYDGSGVPECRLLRQCRRLGRQWQRRLASDCRSWHAPTASASIMGWHACTRASSASFNDGLPASTTSASRTRTARCLSVCTARTPCSSTTPAVVEGRMLL